jgi:hypothetical protein
MKFIVVIAALLLLSCVSYSQQVMDLGRGSFAIDGWLFSTHTNYTSSTADTTGAITIGTLGDAPLRAKYVAIIAVATDSVEINLNVIGWNRYVGLTATKTVYVDSITTLGAGAGTAWSATAPKLKVVVLKGPNKDNLPACTDFKVGVNALATQGTTSGRYLKLYLCWQN